MYEAARALETLAELRQRLETTARVIRGEFRAVDGAMARVSVVLAQLSSAIEEAEALAEHEVDAWRK